MRACMRVDKYMKIYNPYYFNLEHHTKFDSGDSTTYKKGDKADYNYRNIGTMTCDFGTDVICVSILVAYTNCIT